MAKIITKEQSMPLRKKIEAIINRSGNECDCPCSGAFCESLTHPHKDGCPNNLDYVDQILQLITDREKELQENKFVELDPSKEYVLIAKRGSINARDLTLPKGIEYKKPIPIIWVNNMKDTKFGKLEG